MNPPRVRSAASKLAVVLGVIALVAIAWALGLFRLFEDPAKAARVLADLGPWGWLAFVAAYAALQPFGVPGTVFVLAAPLIWPWPIAYALSMTGTMAASVIGFSFARFVARDWVARRVPKRFAKYEDALARRAFATVFTLRFVFWMPQVLHAFFGVSGVRFSTHFWGSLAGYAIPLLAVSFFGRRLFEALEHAPPAAWAGVFAAAIAIGLGVWLVRRARRATS